MSDAPLRDRGQANDADEDSSNGPNLKLIYSLIALAIVLALGLASLIVLPFYQRR
jgi:hypothetical protein